MDWPQDTLSHIRRLPREVKLIVGIDEVGRGSLAGPMVLGVSAVLRSKLLLLEDLVGLGDSKQLTSTERQRVLAAYQSRFPQIKPITNTNHSNVLENFRISARRIDRLGIRRSYFDLLTRVKSLYPPQKTIFLLDYGIPIPDWMIYYQNFKKGDARIPVIALASVHAKEVRDKYMKTVVHRNYPEYGFATNVGYGTVKHRDAICRHGLTGQHRSSFCRKLITKSHH